jgi:hypothetical protein
VEVYLCAFLTFVFNAGEWSASLPEKHLPEPIGFTARWILGLTGSLWKREKSGFLTEYRTFIPRTSIPEPVATAKVKLSLN